MTLDLQAAARHIRRGRLVVLVGLVALAGLYVRALLFTPTERAQGLVQKIYYIHPPAAYAMQMAFVIAGIAGVLYLLMRDHRLDLVGEASAEIGLVMSVVVLITGPIWGKPAWGVWWAWEPRLTFTLIEVLVFAGYFALRSALFDPVERARYGAVLAIMALVLVPFNHMTVYLFPSQHPIPITMKPEKPSLPPEMLITFLAGFLIFTVLYVGMLMQRYGIGIRQAVAEGSDA